MIDFRNHHTRLFAGAVLISFSPVWVQLTSVAPTTSAFYRVFIGAIALMTVLAIGKRGFGLSKRAWMLLALCSIFFALDLWFWHRSIDYIGPGLATLLANFQVFFLMLAGVVVMHQTPRPAQLLAVLLAMLGLALIIGFDWQGLTTDYRLGVILALLCAVAYAGYILTLRASRSGSVHRIPTREVAAVSVFTALILGAAIAVEGQSFAIPTLADAGWLLAYGILSHCIGWLLIAGSLPHVSPTEAGLALLVQPTLSFVWDVAFFDRPLTALELTGAVIALFAIYLGSRSPAAERTE